MLSIIVLQVANVLYFDTPVGTGLSYSSNKDDYGTNDTLASEDLHLALIAWFNEYQALQSNDLYLSGMSSAKHIWIIRRLLERNIAEN